MTPVRPAVPPSLLVVSADPALAARMGTRLMVEGFSVAWEATPGRAMARLAAEPGKLLLLDIPPGGLSEFDGLRTGDGAPFLAIVGSTDRQAKAALPENRRLVRPAADEDIAARILGLRTETAEAPQRGNIVTAGQFHLEPDRRSAAFEGRRLELTWSEFDVLYLLVVRLGEIVSREQLHRRVTGLPYAPLSRAIDVHVSRLRKKLVAAGLDPARLRSVRGEGYVLLGNPGDKDAG